MSLTQNHRRPALSRASALFAAAAAIALVACGCAANARKADGPAPAPEIAYTFTAEELAGFPVRGADNAAVTIVEFSDFQCIFCWLGESALRQTLDKYKDRVRLVWVHAPLKVHSHALQAAVASEIAHEQGKFWEFHDALYATQAEWSGLDDLGFNAELLELAGQTGLDIAKFSSALAQPAAYEAIVERHRGLALKASVHGTPMFFVNGALLSGAQPFEAFDAAVGNALKALR
jgi:protein-disulfide isomerase